MRKQVRRRHDAYVRAHNVCSEHSALFDATPGGQKMRAALGAQVADVDRLLALQERSIEERRAATEQCRLSREALRDAAKAVVKVGRLVNLDEAIMATMQLPGSPSDDELVAYSRGLLDRVSSHADAFVAEGLPPDVLKNLAEAIQGFVAARDAQASARQRFTAAAESIRDRLAKASKTVGVLETIAVNKKAAQPEVLTKLRIAKRVGPRVTPEPADKPVPRPEPSPAPASAP
jgi:hypothetical protein